MSTSQASGRHTVPSAHSPAKRTGSPPPAAGGFGYLDAALARAALPGLSFPRGLHPEAGRIAELTCKWGLASGLLEDEAAAESALRDKMADAGPQLASAAPAPVTLFISRWTLLLLVLDDVADEEGLTPAKVEAITSGILTLGPGAGLGTGVHAALSGAWRDLLRGLSHISPQPSWPDGFRRAAEEHIASKTTEAHIRESRTVPDLPGYVALRRVTSAAASYAWLTEAAAGSAIPGALRAAAEWRMMHDAFADVWLGIQDICSADKEAGGRGDSLNLVAVAQACLGGTAADAAGWAGQWLGCRAAELRLARRLVEGMAARPGMPPGTAAAVTRYADALWLLLGGHTAWNSGDNPRYTGSATP